MNPTNQPTSINDILGVFGGNREFLVGFDYETMAYLAIIIFVAVFLGMYLALKLAK